MTNFERIKAMSVEEMAEWFDSLPFGDCICCAYQDGNCGDYTCKDGYVKWLESEEEE